MSTAGWCIVPECPCCPDEVYYRFPIDNKILDSWLKAIKSPNSKKPILLRISSRVCSLHFVSEDYDMIKEDDLVLELLKATAIPSIFPWTKSWPFKHEEQEKEKKRNRKKPYARTAKQTFCCPLCDYTTNSDHNLQSHCSNHKKVHLHRCNQCNYSTKRFHWLNIHILRDHCGKNGAEGSLTVGSESAAPSYARGEALKVKRLRQMETSNFSIVKDNEDLGPESISTESSSYDLSSSSHSSIIKSANSLPLFKSSGSFRGDITKICASRKGTKSTPTGRLVKTGIAIKSEVYKSLIVLDSLSSVQEQADEVIKSSKTIVKEEVIKSSETVVKEEVKTSDKTTAGSGNPKQAFICVFSETADD